MPTGHYEKYQPDLDAYVPWVKLQEEQPDDDREEDLNAAEVQVVLPELDLDKPRTVALHLSLQRKLKEAAANQDIPVALAEEGAPQPVADQSRATLCSEPAPLASGHLFALASTGLGHWRHGAKQGS
jgi:hypothetical protein